MKILVTGGTGVIGEGLVPELIARGHSVRLFSRHAKEDANQWPGVQPFEGDVADAATLRGAASRCDSVLHVAGIVEEKEGLTFDAVNVGGTRNVVTEAQRARVRRFVYVSSLGADVGRSDYHRSKREAEEIVAASRLLWTVVRPGNVYGPGDAVVSLLLKMVRTLPVVPVIDDGEQEFQPVWYQDLAKMLACVVERPELAGQTLEAAGPEITTLNDLIARCAEITGRKIARVPVPAALAQVLIDANKLTMLAEKNVVRGRSAAEELRIQTTPLDRGLRLLADSLPEALPHDGFGSLSHKTFHAEIRGSRHSAAALMTMFRDRVNDFMPLEFAAEPGASERIEQGVTLTGSLPLRGHFQVRVEVAEPTRVVFATLEGHPLHGIVEFRTSEENGVLRFSIDNYARAANVFDWFAVKTIGAPAQDANWRAVVQRIVDASGGTSDGVHQASETLDASAGARLEERVRTLVQDRKRSALRAAQ